MKKTMVLAVTLLCIFYGITGLLLPLGTSETGTIFLVILLLCSGGGMALITQKMTQLSSYMVGHLKFLWIFACFLFAIGFLGFYIGIFTRFSALWIYFPDFLTCTFLFLPIVTYSIGSRKFLLKKQ